MKALTRKAQVGSLVPTIISFVIVGMILVIGLVMNATMQTNQIETGGVSCSNATYSINSSKDMIQCSNGTVTNNAYVVLGGAYNATGSINGAFSVITNNLGLLATVIVFGIIIYLVLRYLGGVGKTQ